MNTGQSLPRTGRREGLHPAGKHCRLTGTHWATDIPVLLVKDRIELGNRPSRNLPSPLHRLPRAQDRFTVALEMGFGRLRRDSDRMEGAVIEASSLGRNVFHCERVALGFGQGLAPTGGVAERAVDDGDAVLERISRAWQPDAQQRALALHRAEHGKRALRQSVLDEAHSCALLRADTAGELDSEAAWYRQWLDCFNVALGVAQGEEPHDVEQLSSLLRARCEAMESTALIARQHAASGIEHDRATDHIAL